ncbi:Uu.00g027040.m01.CDS01 [Anthostomella pinea]|uniref:Uu.00g027040.m01.CDS01 n=1 Tax=Anthostomella pinea TaxID=933095 RepID=A0AAI8V7M5_9PEZI|nr:Uu.00g027040.m01.CDS01 [Anthostomella pinea]
MGKKKRGHPDIEEILSRAWCYYCERDFEDLKLLISHQKAKHFKCDRCGRRLNTAGGLSVHMNQVHKESLTTVENALPNRQGLEVEIFGMEGIPEDVVQQHNQRIIQTFYQQQAERFAATGNPPPGERGKEGPAKKIKVESADELKKRLAEHRARTAAQKAAGGSATHTPTQGLPDGHSPAQNGSPGAFNSPFAPPGGQFPGYPQQPVPGYTPPPQYPQAYPPSSLPARPGSNLAAPPGLPARPGQHGWQGNASTIDELVSGAPQPEGDEIDALIRMAENRIKPPKKPDTPATAQPAAEEAAPDKKSKKEKDKNVKMIYEDELSPEERMAMMPRYAFAPQAVA